MNNTTHDPIAAAKALILSKVSYARAAQQLGLDPLTLLNKLRNDKDILEAKAAGLLNKPRNTSRRSNYAEMPWVIDVIDNGLTQSQAAEKHSLSQPYVSKCVKKAREDGQQANPNSDKAGGYESERDALKAAAAAAKEAGVPAAEIVQIVAEVACS